MNVLLSLLQKSTDYNQLLKAVEAKQAVAVSGLSQAPRSHVLAAAQRELSHALDQTCAGIARAGQAFDQLRHTVFRTDPKRHGRGKERLPRERAQQQRVQTCHQHRDASLRQRVQQPQPLLLPLPGHADGPGQRQLTRRQHGRLFA